MTSQLSHIGERALQYARNDLLVFPLAPEKKVPLSGSQGHKAATRDPEEVRFLWLENPRANIGIRTGSASGLIVLDVDGSQGQQNLQELIDCWVSGEFSPTPLVETGNGLHFYFRIPDSADGFPSVTGLYPGIDIKADGGYVVAPPSIHPNGSQYTWHSLLCPDR